MRRTLAPLVFLLFAPPAVLGQTLKDEFSNLFTFGSCGEPLCLDVNSEVHGDHYIPSIVQGEANMLAFLTGAIGQSVANLPFAAASSGVIFTFQGGAPTATPISAGPIFAERATTLGRGRFFASATLHAIDFDNVRGRPLSDLEFRFAHQNVADPTYGDPALENDVIDVTTDIDLSLLVTSIVLGYGVTDRIDVGVAVPLVRASLKGTSHAEINPFDFATSPHAFGTQASPSLTATGSADGSAIGIGDLGLRAKVNATETFSLVGDVRLPTGAEDDFLGSGATTVRVFGVLSQRYGAFTPHANAGFMYTDAEKQNSRILATLGFDHVMSGSVTFAAELIGSFETSDSPLGLPDPVVFAQPVTRTLSLTSVPDRKDNPVDASFGFKYVGGNDTRLVGNVSFPLNDAGMRSRAQWMIGVERVF